MAAAAAAKAVATAAIASHSIAVSPGLAAGTAAKREERDAGGNEVEDGVGGVVEKSLDELLEVMAQSTHNVVAIHSGSLMPCTASPHFPDLSCLRRGGSALSFPVTWWT